MDLADRQAVSMLQGGPADHDPEDAMLDERLQSPPQSTQSIEKNACLRPTKHPSKQTLTE